MHHETPLGNRGSGSRPHAGRRHQARGPTRSQSSENSPASAVLNQYFEVGAAALVPQALLLHLQDEVESLGPQ